MSGPPYPLPVPGSNAIGQFQIGVSPIGDMIPFSYWQTIISQYANSDILTTLIGNFDSYIDQTQNMEMFYDDIWNVSTAYGYGIDVWGRIVGVNRVVNISAGSWFGFEEAAALEGGVNISGFNQMPFYSGQQTTQNFILNDETFRAVIFAKAAFNITNGSVPAINAIMMALFPHQGNAYVVEGPTTQTYFGFEESFALGSPNVRGFNQAQFYSGASLNLMAMQYTFTFPLTNVQLAIAQSGVLPKPAGVLATVVIIPPSPP